MKNDKVDVIIPQTRHEELLEKEKELVELKKTNLLYIGYKYLDLKSANSVLMSEDRDSISFLYHAGDNIPQDIKDYVEEKSKEILHKIEILNEHRLEKIEAAKLHLIEQIEWKYAHGFSPEWHLLDWLGIKWNELIGKKK